MPSPSPQRAGVGAVHGRRTHGRAGRRTGAVLAAAALLLGGLVGCSGGSDPAEPQSGATGSAGPSGSAAPRPVATRARAGEVMGRTRPAARRQAVRAVRRVVDGWIDAAYVDGPWPRKRVTGSFPGFTPAARRLAAGDARITTNAPVASRIDGVRATRRRLVVDMLANRRRTPVAATARLDLAYRTTGTVQRMFHVRGRLYLTRTSDGWRVFGYQLTKGSR